MANINKLTDDDVFSGSTPPPNNLNPKKTGSVYVDSNTGKVYTCKDNTPNKNIWILLSNNKSESELTYRVKTGCFILGKDKTRLANYETHNNKRKNACPNEWWFNYSYTNSQVAFLNLENLFGPNHGLFDCYVEFTVNEFYNSKLGDSVNEYAVRGVPANKIPANRYYNWCIGNIGWTPPLNNATSVGYEVFELFRLSIGSVLGTNKSYAFTDPIREKIYFNDFSTSTTLVAPAKSNDGGVYLETPQLQRLYFWCDGGPNKPGENGAKQRTLDMIAMKRGKWDSQRWDKAYSQTDLNVLRAMVGEFQHTLIDGVSDVSPNAKYRLSGKNDLIFRCMHGELYIWFKAIGFKLK